MRCEKKNMSRSYSEEGSELATKKFSNQRKIIFKSPN